MHVWIIRPWDASGMELSASTSQCRWKECMTEKVWIRKPFHEAENHTGKWIVFGHTPVYGLLNEPVGTENLWISDQKMGVDGGAVFGGVLHGLLLDDQGIVHDHVLHNTGFSAADD